MIMVDSPGTLSRFAVVAFDRVDLEPAPNPLPGANTVGVLADPIDRV